ncbi:MAG: phosphate ABC transporter permease subunit PstC [Bulleidia sp.]
MKWNQTIESVMKYVFLVAAVFSIAAVILICFFLFANGIPAIREIGVVKFLLGTTWAPSNNEYGILPMIVGSFYITAGAILFGVPIGILTSVFMTFYCPKKIYRPLKSATELLAGIPSVVYGFFGMIVLVPAVYRFEKMLDISGKGNSIFTASLLLGIMILPSIIGVCESALRAVPQSYYEGSSGLGATKERTIFKVILPSASSGVLAGVVLGIGRAIGETMAVVMIAGNQPRIPTSIFKGVRTMTANIVIEMGYATDLHRESLIATGVVLFVFILLINASVAALKRKQGEHA